MQKLRQRRRLRAVDLVVDTVAKALAKKGETLKSLDRWKEEMPTEAQMLPRDKYTMFDRKAKKYRKGIHSTCPMGGIVGSWCNGVVWLTIGSSSRTPQVDSRVAKSQPARLLDDDEERRFEHVYPLYYTNGINGVMTALDVCGGGVGFGQTSTVSGQTDGSADQTWKSCRHGKAARTTTPL